jgi:uncharacterized protein YneF (UPF0154 family)
MVLKTIPDLVKAKPADIEKILKSFPKDKVARAIEIVRSQPGRPPREQLIQQVMRNHGKTRKQAKDMIDKHDDAMARQFLLTQQRQETDDVLAQAVEMDRIKPLTRAVVKTMYPGMGF